MTRLWLVSSAISGFVSVLLGAFGAHALKEKLAEYGKASWETAVTYQMFHTLALLGIGLLQRQNASDKLDGAGWAFLLGILLFSGSLYVLALTRLTWLGAVTPFGGVAFLIGWLWLAYALSTGK